MAKVILKESNPNSPIYNSGSQIFVPVSKPSTESLKPSMDGTNQPQDSSNNPKYQPNEEELADIKAESIRRLKVRQLFKGRLEQTPNLSELQNNTPKTME